MPEINYNGDGAYHRRFRPRNISEYVGNTQLKNTVLNALQYGRRPQVILLQGHAGCGKTTMGRLLAMEYNCEDRNALTGACGKCPSCEAYQEYIETGDASGVMDLYEYDCSKVGKAESTAIEENMKSGSIIGGWKVYIFDEAHLLTAGAEGGLLKVIEEPPEQVLIILCTTNPEEILDTIKSRCQLTLTVTKPSREELGNLLVKVCNHENVEFDDKGISALCVHSSFVPRQALIALETVVKTKGKVTVENVTEALGVIADEHYFRFYELLSAKHVNIYAYIQYIGKLKETVNLELFVDNLIDFTTRGIYINNGIKMDGVDEAEIKRYSAIFSKFNEQDIAYILTTLMDIKASRNFEARLLLLGYTGIYKPTVEISGVKEDKGIPENDAGKVAQIGTEKYVEKLKPSEEMIESAIEGSYASLSKQDLISKFGGMVKR